MNMASDDEDDEFDSLADGLSESQTRLASATDFNHTDGGTKQAQLVFNLFSVSIKFLSVP